MSATAIDEFWRWWATASGAFAESFSAGASLKQELIEAMSAHVTAIHESLDWEFGPGLRSAHHLCLSGKGDPALRVVAERWKKRAPAPDGTWEYHASRQAWPGEGLELEIGGEKIALKELVFAVEEDESRELLDVRGFHPAYPRIEDQDLRMRILFIALDNLLGEDGVERWLGSVDESLEPLPAGLSHGDLRRRVDELASRATRERWAVLQGQRGGEPVFVTTNLALKRIDHLLLDMHLVVDLPLLAPTETGLTTNEEADVLNALEDELVTSLGEHAVLAGRETTGGHRTVHLRVMEGGPARALVDRWVARHPERSPKVEVQMDPRWDALDRWR
jgi:hypothetical protein